MRRESGITLIELLVAMAIASISGAMLVTLFVGQERAMRGQRNAVDMQDNGRVALEMLMRDVRNAGFLVPSESAVRIEDNCGAANNDLGYNLSTGTWAIRTATDRMNNGDIVGISDAGIPSEACPNGSDRITVVTKPDMQVIGTCSPAGCLTNNSGLGNVLRVPCFGTTSSTSGDCQKTLDMMGKEYNLSCPGGGAPYPTIYLNACNEEDPSQCTTLPIKKHDCDKSCPTKGSGGTNLKCIQFNLDSFSGSSWTAIGGDKDGASISGFVFRTYQILDVDADGSTELVYSDRIHGRLVDPSTAGSAEWVVVARNIDDLQFAWSRFQTPDTFDRRTLYNLGSCTAEVAGATGYHCLPVIANTPANPLAAIRVSLVARTPQRERNNNDQVIPDGRPALENNAPALLPYNPSLATSQGCTAANYETCSGNGNAQGFRRRIYSETVSMRNLIGFQ